MLIYSIENSNFIVNDMDLILVHQKQTWNIGIMDKQLERNKT